jgi:hypothetical protein
MSACGAQSGRSSSTRSTWFFTFLGKVTAPAIIAYKPAFLGFMDGLTVTDLNDFNGPAQTTNLGVRSSNLFGRAIQNKTTNISVLDLSTCSGGLQDILAANNPDGVIVDFNGIEDRSDVALPGIDVGRVASFAGGVAKDEAAVRAAITLPWSNGQTEGQITVSSSSNVRCTAAAKSTFFRPD